MKVILFIFSNYSQILLICIFICQYVHQGYSLILNNTDVNENSEKKRKSFVKVRIRTNELHNKCHNFVEMRPRSHY